MRIALRYESMFIVCTGSATSEFANRLSKQQYDRLVLQSSNGLEAFGLQASFTTLSRGQILRQVGCVNSPGGPGRLPAQGSHRSARAHISAYGSSDSGFATQCGQTNERCEARAKDSVAAVVGIYPTSCCVRNFCDPASIAIFVRSHRGICPVRSHCRLYHNMRNVHALFGPA